MDATDVFDRFSDDSMFCLNLAFEEAMQFHVPTITVYMMLLGMLRTEEGPAYQALINQGLDLDVTRERVAELISHPRLDGAVTESVRALFQQDAKLSPAFKRVVDLAAEISDKFGDTSVEPQHLLFAITEVQKDEVLAGVGIDFDRLRSDLKPLFSAEQS